MSRSPEITHKIMSAIKSEDTKPELLLGSAMWRLGLRYRKHYKIKGKPDFVFIKAKIAVFCDGDFWHGHNWKIRGLSSLEEELASYNDFWRKKIMRNIERDKEVTDFLKSEGWTVIRFWESEVKVSAHDCALKVKNKII
jgi:DNA mismatch endonuclease (patch repair protein)